MEQLRRQGAPKINLRRILGTVNALSESEKNKRKDNIDNNTTKDIRNLFILKKPRNNQR